jgi:hypothetical protein
MTTTILDKAKQIEALLTQALKLAEGTEILSLTFTNQITAARNNAMKRAHYASGVRK